ncbi:potassium transporter TrkA [Halolamina sp. CBA1230]|uniref:cation:proton antiporter regulatory subunit n=1 Tax=Halolamina sp. CBA1230 TaxID=1853690 RepID=UPI0009A2202A|nr:TrkA C-terminal domain-containing protein [Halolamina sp. CBA1230]QKY20026.1 potassium transporter TrkA [Halolamina sp. CBA1230]
MTVYETDLPGVGRKFDLELDAGGVASVVVHHDGRCELYRRADRDAGGEKLLNLNSEEANKLGSILEGAYFESVNVDELSVPLGDAIIEWVEVGEGSALDGTTLAESEIKGETGATVIAVQRGSETVSNPDADFELAGGDLLVAIGTHEEQAALKDRVQD